MWPSQLTEYSISRTDQSVSPISLSFFFLGGVSFFFWGGLFFSFFKRRKWVSKWCDKNRKVIRSSCLYNGMTFTSGQKHQRTPVTLHFTLGNKFCRTYTWTPGPGCTNWRREKTAVLHRNNYINSHPRFCYCSDSYHRLLTLSLVIFYWLLPEDWDQSRMFVVLRVPYQDYSQLQ